MGHRRLVTVGLVVVLSIVLTLRLARRTVAVAVDTAEVTSGPIVREVLATGTLQPAHLVDVGAEVSGTVQSLDADFNTPVRAGQVIARIDPSRYHTQLIEAQGKLGQAQGELAKRKVLADDARLKLERAEDLAAQHLIPEAELDAARLTMRQEAAELRGQMAAVTAAQAEIRQTRLALERTVIRSPIDGIVINRHVEAGQTLASAFQSPVLFTIADLREMHLLVDVNEGEVAGVEPGAVVTFRLESPDNPTFDGTIAQVRLQPVVEAQPVATSGTSAATPTSSPGTSTPSSGTSGSPTPSPNTAGRANQPASSSQVASSPSQAPAASSSGVTTAAANVVSYVAVIEVPNPEGVLQPGSTAIVNLATARRERAVRIPNAALAFRPSREVAEAVGQRLEDLEPRLEQKPAQGRTAVVWVFRNQRFEALMVDAGIADDTWTELVSGPIAPGDLLVTNATIRK